ncbi:Rne/Rng family ribonuclease [Halocynthiibacter sp. C4]|uniref:Rne/Rng family ribonuclease n=1 Tax=Halocynthiibacter sp. C4 TaxID=2992758 RepID=UPI00237B1B01|nr:Rne/Rng family ribonuclease [Halocynthiibacter sp. C4]MDE0589385.1 Rne/Rng family ribonuclease [Halocynthiibacter sp. C4]
MAKKMLIDATHAEETRVVVVDGTKVEEFDFESENRRQLAGNIYLAKVTRVEPSLQAAFIDYGGNRHGFLAFSEIHPDYYQIPVADREALLAEERAYAKSLEEEDEKPAPKRRRRRRGKAAENKSNDAVETKEVEETSASKSGPSGMDVVDLDESEEGSSPMELVGETPVETPAATEGEAETAKGAQDESTADAAADEKTEATKDAETPVEDASKANAKSDDAGEDASEDDTDDNDDDDDDAPLDATEKDDQIESVADEDVTEEIRVPRKRRPRKYKIQEVIKVRQILLVQVVKEERGNKGAALTTYLSLAGRYCVLMPNTARGGGISRKITNVADRKKLKQIAQEIDVPEGAGLIVRTAGAERTKPEIKRDYEYLQRLWEQIRALTLKSIAPAKIYEEGDLIKRSIRDLYNRDIDEVAVEGEAGYRVAKDFMKMIMPSHAKNVKRYTDPLPLFARYQVESYLAGMFNPTVQLKSGGYIVIGVTEALVAIDVNSGRATKEGSIEDTAVKTNLEAADEVARQLRLRDLAGLIVIDFIDMEDRRNNAAVEKRMKEKLKTDRARIQVGRISGFGLMEMSRQRLRPGMIEATTQPCHHCHGTGLIRSDDNLALSILRQLEEEGVRRRSREVLLKVPVGIMNFLVNTKREHIAQIEARYGLSVRIEADPFLVSPDFSIERFKTATRNLRETAAPVVSVDASLMDGVDEDIESENGQSNDQNGENSARSEEEQQPKKRRRRRRRRRGGGGNNNADAENANNENATDTQTSDDKPTEAQNEEKADAEAKPAEAADSSEAKTEEAPKKRRRAPRKKASDAEVKEVASTEGEDAKAESAEEEKPAKKPARRRTSKKKEAAEAADQGDATVSTDAPEAASEEAPAKPARKRAPRKKAKEDASTEAAAEEAPAKKTRSRKPKAKPAEEAPAVAAEPAKEEAAIAVATPEPEAAPVAKPEPEPVAAAPEVKEKPKKKGWWSLGK